MTIDFELRPGARVRYHPAHDPTGWREGELVRPSANGEEWLVTNEYGRFWLALSRLVPAPERFER